MNTYGQAYCLLIIVFMTAHCCACACANVCVCVCVCVCVRVRAGARAYVHVRPGNCVHARAYLRVRAQDKRVCSRVLYTYCDRYTTTTLTVATAMLLRSQIVQKNRAPNYL